MEFISENFKIIILAFIALFAGIALTLKIKNKNTNKVTQKNNTAGGDMAGRDVKKK